MKFRLDFVTNSSSSCYVCEICGEAQESYDGPECAGMTRCANGHVFCHSEKLMVSKTKLIAELIAHDISFDETDNLEELLSDAVYDSETPPLYCPICQFKHWTDWDMNNYLSKKYGFSIGDYRKQFTEKYGLERQVKDSEYQAFMAVKFGFDLADILCEWESEFHDYDNLLRYLRGGR